MSGKSRSVQHSMQGVFVFVLLGLFALMSTLMVLLGAQMYRGTVAHSQANSDSRVLGAYVRSMVRAQDTAGGVRVERQGEMPVLALHEDIDGTDYVTWIYGWEGSVYEQFTEAAYAFKPEAGTIICGAGGFEPQIENGLLTIRARLGVDDTRTIQVALRCGQESGAAEASEAAVTTEAAEPSAETVEAPAEAAGEAAAEDGLIELD